MNPLALFPVLSRGGFTIRGVVYTLGTLYFVMYVKLRSGMYHTLDLKHCLLFACLNSG